MTRHKLKYLFNQASHDVAPLPPEGFDARVMAAVRRNEAKVPAASWWEQLEELFPRLAVATVLTVVLCVASDFYFSSAYATSFTGDVGAISEQWLFAANGN